MNTITIGVDLAKNAFSACVVDGTGRVLRRLDFKRAAFASWLVQQPGGTIVAMEACSGAHLWARLCLEHGLVPRLMAAQFVRPLRQNPLAKNDPNDAEAIERTRPSGAVHTLVRTSTIGATRPFTEMQSDNRSPLAALTRSAQDQHRHQRKHERSRQEHHARGVDGKSLTE